MHAETCAYRGTLGPVVLASQLNVFGISDIHVRHVKHIRIRRLYFRLLALQLRRNAILIFPFVPC
jgi:hypothetical protein